MKFLLTCSLLLSILSTYAQDNSIHEVDSNTFTKVEIEAFFPGGNQAWLRFLNKNLRYPDDAVSNNIQGDVVVQFIVDTGGNTSDFQAISGPKKGGLREEAIRILQLSGPWVPSIQNSHKAKSYKRQTISFKLVRG
jgi:protein TonB